MHASDCALHNAPAEEPGRCSCRRAPNTQVVSGMVHWRGPKGELVPESVVKDQHRLQDMTVREIFGRAQELAKIITAFKVQAFEDVDALQQLLAERYKAKVGGAKGNLTLYSYDGLVRIQVQVADLIKLGPELQVAKTLIDGCLSRWTDGARAELRAIVMNAFKTDKEGQVNRAALLGLQRLEIADEDWQSAMRAITDAQQVIGSKRYIRFGVRESADGAWAEVSLNVATA